MKRGGKDIKYGLIVNVNIKCDRNRNEARHKISTLMKFKFVCDRRKSTQVYENKQQE